MLYQQENFGIENHHDIRLYTSINFVSHLHRDAELVSVIEGKLYISTDKGREALSAGDCALILPDKIHSYETPEYSKAVVHVFSADNAGSFFKKIRGFEGDLPRLRKYRSFTRTLSSGGRTTASILSKAACTSCLKRTRRR